MRTRIPAIARKETLHIVRDWRTLAMAFGLPMAMIFLFSYAITFDIQDLRIVVADQDNTLESRELVGRFIGSGYFKLAGREDSAEKLRGWLDRGDAQIAMAIPRGYSTALARMEQIEVQVLFDGSDNNTATIAENYVETIIAGKNSDLVQASLRRFGVSPRGLPPIDSEVRVWFNPTLASTNTIVPGLVAVIMMMVSALLTSLTVVRERENGSLEGLIATPVKKREIVVGKMLPYLAISMIDCLLVTGIGVIFFGVPFAGDFIFFTLAALIFSVAGLAIGLFASVVATNQLFANQIVVLTTLLPSMLLSGFMFPIKSMPHWVQAVTHAVPARYFVTICRGVMLKDQPIEILAEPALFLFVFSFILMNLSVARFKKKL